MQSHFQASQLNLWFHFYRNSNLLVVVLRMIHRWYLKKCVSILVSHNQLKIMKDLVEIHVVMICYPCIIGIELHSKRYKISNELETK